MLSTSISDEIYNKTLGLLMTTPISGFQIVLGKLSSKLLQLVLLLGISLPLLAIVRVFGGVPWAYVLSSLCITLTAAIFVATISLAFSIRNRRAYAVIIKTAVTAGFLFGLLPMIAALIGMASIPAVPGRPFSFHVSWDVISHFSPYYAMSLNTAMLMSPTAMGRFYWPVHCAVMLGLSMMLMAVCAGVVRKVALRQATGGGTGFRPVKRRPRWPWRKNTAKMAVPLRGGRASQVGQGEDAAGVIRRVRGWPVFWKDIRAPLIRGGEGRNSVIGLIVTIAVLLTTYGIWAKGGFIDEDFTHVSLVVLFVLIVMVFHIVLSASSITSEKESRAWPILLATSMGDWQIFWGKAAAVSRRCLVVWLLAAGHVVLFVVVGYIHPIAIIHLFMIMVWVTVFLTSMGLYFSARFRRTTSAVVATFGFAAAIWIVAPAVGGLISAATRDRDVVQACKFANPAVQVYVVMAAAGGRYNAHAGLANLKYDWLDEEHNVESATVLMAAAMLIYVFFGLLFAWRAKCRFRVNVF